MHYATNYLLFSSVGVTPIDSRRQLKALVASSAAKIPFLGRTIFMAVALSSFLVWVLISWAILLEQRLHSECTYPIVDSATGKQLATRF